MVTSTLWDLHTVYIAMDTLRDHCYQFPNHKLTWQKAERYCASFDREGYSESHLASVHSQEENDWIRMRLVKKRITDDKNYRAWNGYHYSPDHGSFVWSDQSSKDFENWADGQPDEVATFGITCAHFSASSEQFIDKDCQKFYFFVCKRAASFWMRRSSIFNIIIMTLRYTKSLNYGGFFVVLPELFEYVGND